MRACVGLLIFLANLRHLSAKYVESTLSVFDEVEDLKQQIRNKIYLKRPPVNNQYTISKQPEEIDRFEFYDYVDENRDKLLPIRSNDEHAKKNLGFLRPLKTTPAADSDQEGRKRMLLPLRSRDMLNVTGRSERTTDNTTDSRRSSYYYRFAELRDKQLPWVQARVLITPFLTGQISNASEYNEVGMNNHVFTRFLELLHYNTTGQDIADTQAVLTQIFHLKLRLFLWSIKAITTLLNQLIIGKQHSFGELKAGLKRQFREWHLDVTASMTLIKDAKMFRPPCINWRPGGSTKEYTRKTLTPPMSPTTRTPCPSSNENTGEQGAGLREGDAVESAEAETTEATEATEAKEATEATGATEAAAVPLAGGVATAALPPVEPAESNADDETQASGNSERDQRVERTVIEWVHPRAKAKRKGRRGKKRKPKHHRHKLERQ